MKLELKHLATYLPYGINILSKIENGIDKYPFEPCEIVSVDMLSKSITVRHMVGYNEDVEYITYKNISDIKLILIPLSELTKESAINYGYSDEHHLERSILSGHVPCKIWIELISEHYDVFGLIEKGLADVKKPTKKAFVLK